MLIFYELQVRDNFFDTFQGILVQNRTAVAVSQSMSNSSARYVLQIQLISLSLYV